MIDPSATAVLDDRDLPLPTRRELPAVHLDVERIEQPDDLTCGPTALLQIYRYHGLDLGLDDVLRNLRRNPDGGTLAVYLALAALERGWTPTLFSYNLDVFDPTWKHLDAETLAAKLEAREPEVEGERLRRILRAYAELVRRGGRIRLADLERRLIVGLLAAGHPVLTGLSATWLYQSARELAEEDDDVAGWPVGHFVVISGYEPLEDRFLVVDPSRQTPLSKSGVYAVPSERLMASVLLGGATDDAVLLVLERTDGLERTDVLERRERP